MIRSGLNFARVILKTFANSIRNLRIKVIIPVSLLVFGATFSAANASFQPMEYSIVITPDHFPIVFPKRNADGDPVDYGEPKTISAAELLNTDICHASANCSTEAIAAGAVYYRVKSVPGVGDVIIYYDELGNLIGTQKVAEVTGFDATLVGSSDSNQYNPQVSTTQPQRDAEIEKFFSSDYANYAVGSTNSSFEVSPSGSANYSIPLVIPPAINGLQPELSINYNNQGGNGLLGVGFSVGGLSAISRCSKTLAQDPEISPRISQPVNYTNDDAFCIDGQRLIQINAGSGPGLYEHGTVGAEYRTEIESFSRIKVIEENAEGPTAFKVETKSGQTFIYAASYVYSTDILLTGHADPSKNNTKVLVWPVLTIRDVSGQRILFSYRKITDDSATEYWPTEIYYGADDLGDNTVIQFDYFEGERSDTTVGYSHGYKFKSSKLMKGISIFSPAGYTRQYRFSYEEGSSGRKRMKSILECGPGSIGYSSATNNCLPPIEFDWSEGPTGLENRGKIASGLWGWLKGSEHSARMNTLDLSVDGFTDLLTGPDWSGNWFLTQGGIDSLNGSNGAAFSTPGFTKKYPDYEFSQRLNPMDLDGDGVQEMVWGPSGPSGTWYIYKKNSDGSNTLSGAAFPKAYQPWAHKDPGYVRQIDLDGDGRQDLIIGPDANGHFHAMKSNGTTLVKHDSYYSSGLGLFSSNAIWGSEIVNDHMYVVDANGDGLQDMMLGPNQSGEWDLFESTGSGFIYHSNYVTTISTDLSYQIWWDDNSSPWRYSTARDYNAKNIRFMDVNGDGLQDMVFGPRYGKNGDNTTRGGWYVYLNTGNGFVSGGRWAVTNADWWDQNTGLFRPMDVNADGKMDIVYGPHKTTGSWTLLESTGTGFINKGVILTAYAGYGDPSNQHRIHAGDFDGDGMLDLALGSNGDGNWYGVKLNGGQPDQLVGISNGPSPKTTIEYEYLTRGGDAFYKKGDKAVSTDTTKTITMPMKVVKTVSKGDGVGGIATTTYAYEDLRVNRQGRGMLGFRKVTSTDSSTGEVLVTEYGQSFPYTGLTLKSEKRVNGQKVETVDKKYAYKITHAGVVYPVNYENISEAYELGYASPYKRTSVWTGAYANMTPYSNGDPCATEGYACKPSPPPEYQHLDEYGNILWMKTITEDLSSNQVWSQETTSSYYNNPDSWILGRLTSSTVVHSNSLADVPDITRKSAFTYYDNGQLKTEIIEPNDQDLTQPNAADPSLSKITTYGYDPVTGLKNHVEEQGWDSQGNPLPLRVADTTTVIDNSTFSVPTIKATITNGLGESETTWTSLIHSGQLAHVGPNGKRTITGYDSLGRKISTTDESLNVTKLISYAWTYNKPLNSIYKITTKTDGLQDDSSVYYDELNREIRTTSRSMDGREVVKETVYNHRGLIEKVNRPYLAYSTPVWLCFEYDDLGRVTNQSMPKAMTGTPDCGPGSIRSNTQTEYNGLETTVTVAGKFKKQEKKNVIDKTEWVVDAKDSTEESRLDYTYYATGELHTVKDALGKVTRLIYDNNGRKKEMHDPAMGHWSYSYNSFGELESQTDAMGNVITMEYDVVGRMTHRNEVKVAGGTDQWVWTYVHLADKDATHPVGKLKEVSGPNNYLKTFEYDPVTLKPQKVTERQNLPSGSDETLEQSFTYDGYGRLATQTLPGETSQEVLVVANEYNDYGYQVAVKSPSTASTPEAKAKLQNLIQQTEQKLLQANQRASSYLSQAASYQQKAIEYETYAISVLQREAYAHKVDGEQAAEAAAYVYPDDYDSVLGCISAGSYNNPLFSQCAQRWGQILSEKKQAEEKQEQIRNDIPAKLLSLYKAANDLRDISQALIVKANTEKVEAAKAHAAAVNKTDPTKTPSQHRLAAQARAQQASYYLDQARVLVTQLKEGGVSVPNAGVFNGAKIYLQTVEDQLNKAQTAYTNAGEQMALAERYDNYLTGLNTSLTDNNQITWWRAITADAEGRVTEATYGNGTTTTRDYDPNTGQLWSIQTSNGVETLQNLSYEYDDLNNVTKRIDHKLNTTETYVYDDLDRLTSTTLEVAGVGGAATRTRLYNEIGDITQIDGQDLTYDMTTGQMTGSPIQGNEFDYDNNGNQTLSAGRTIDYSIFNKPIRLSKGQGIVEYNYGPDRGRILKVNKTSNILDKTTVYFGGYEKITDFKTQKVTHRYTISAGGALVAVRNVTDGIASNSFMHADALGSTDLITTDKGQLLEHLGYTPFGKRRDMTALNALSDYISLSIYAFSSKNITERGFTGHEHIDELELIHMNGRVYDPIAGRFLSPDTIVQAPKDTQSYNRYAYVKNNPLKYTDPSGHSWLSRALKSVGRFVKTYGAQIVVVALSIVTAGAAAMAYTGAATMSAALGTAAGAIVGGAVGGFVGGFLGSGGDLRAGITGAVFGALSAGAARWVKGLGYGTWGASGMHGLAQGFISEMRGGTFKEGFLSAFASHAVHGLSQDNNWLPSMKDTSSNAIVIRTTVSAMAGGVSSSLGGGKFKNGAVTAGFVHLFNAESGDVKSPKKPKDFTSTGKEMLDVADAAHEFGSQLESMSDPLTGCINKNPPTCSPSDFDSLSEKNLSIYQEAAEVGPAYYMDRTMSNIKPAWISRVLEYIFVRPSEILVPTPMPQQQFE